MVNQNGYNLFIALYIYDMYIWYTFQFSLDYVGLGHIVEALSKRATILNIFLKEPALSLKHIISQK